MTTQFPIAARVPVERTHHGDTVVDEYEWLRDKESPQVLEHLRAENAYTEVALKHLEPLREKIFGEIVARTQQTDLSVPSRRGDWWYFGRTREGSQYPVYCRSRVTDPQDWTPPVLDREAAAPGEEVLIDGNELAADHSFFSLGAVTVSDDGQWLAYSTDTVGDERFTLRIKNLATGELLPDELAGISYGASFSADASMVFYTVVDDAWRPYQVRRHQVGTPVADDVVVLTEPDERFWLGFDTSTDNRYLLLHAGSKVTSEFHVLDLAAPTGAPVLFAGRREGVEYEIDHLPGSDDWVVVHNDGAPNFTLAVAQPGETWRPLELFDESRRITGAVALQNHLAVELRLDGLPTVVLVPREGDGFGDPWPVTFQTPLANMALGAVMEAGAPLLRLAMTSFVTPASTYDLDLHTRELLLRKQTEVLGVDLSDYEESREWAEASDGTRVPISVVHRRGVRPDGGNPVVLYGYGSYETSMDPAFTVPRLSLLDRGVVFALAHVRGGGEMGRAWYEQGRLLHKKNTFTDFVSCAEHLEKAGWAEPRRIVAMGGSAGGLLMGAVANLAPEQFAGILGQVPFVDTLTTILDPSLPLTVIEWDEWGDPLHDADAYAYIKSYSPYDNIRAVQYPRILALTSLHDTRVLYVEPAKWVARLRHTLTEAGLPGAGDILLKTEMDGGHAGASGRYEVWKERAYELAWILDTFGAGTA